MRMSKATKCVGCGKTFPRKLLNRQLRCWDCAQKAVVDNARQLHAHTGPAYEKWRKATKRALGRL